MTKIEMVQQAMQALGEAAPETLAAFVRKTYGEAIDARYIPFFVASVRDRMRLEALRKERAARAPAETETRT